MENFWEHKKIEEFLNDEDIFLFIFEREELEKIQKIKDENKIKILIENIKIKKIKYEKRKESNFICRNKHHALRLFAGGHIGSHWVFGVNNNKFNTYTSIM